MHKLLVAAALVASFAPSLAHAELRTAKRAAEPMRVAKADALTVDGMLGKIHRTYMQGMQRCYVKGLAQDGSLEGTVSIVFTVNPRGRVSGTVSGITPKVDSCITNQLTSWRFPTPRDAKDKPTQATFKINLLLARQ
jgi:hypothetical protein